MELEKLTAAFLDIKTNGEFGEAKRTPASEVVLNPGDPACIHVLTILPWDKKLGPDVTDLTKFTALYRELFGCKSCDHKVIVSKRALI